MAHAELLKQVEAHDALMQEVQSSAHAVWIAFCKAEPALAKEVLQLFPSDGEAANWVVTSLKALGRSPARKVAEGRAAEVAARVQKAIHGFAG